MKKGLWSELIIMICVCVTIVCFIAIFSYIAYQQGMEAGDRECKAISQDIERKQIKARAMLIKSSEILANNRETVDSCLEIGQFVVQKGQRVRWTENICLRCHPQAMGVNK